MQRKAAIVAIAAASALCGCGLGASPPATFDLEAPAVSKVQGTRAVQLTINPPNAIKTIDTDEILVKGANGRVAYLSGVAWGDRLPRLFQARLVEAFANSGAFRAVLTNQDRVSGDLSLSIEIRDFEVETAGGGSNAFIDVYVKLVDERNNTVMTTKTFQARRNAASEEPNAGIHALNAAFQQVALEIVSWVSRRSA
ncbi:MAG: ABC-type transport auxiliary lipoprotein family protein [Rhodomicrobium sp.]